MGNLSMYYNNVEIFKGVVEMRRGKDTRLVNLNVCYFVFDDFSWMKTISCLVLFFGFFFLGLCAKIIDQTRTMADVYGAFYDFCCIMESKV